jgi:hypothetical protein
MLRDSARFAACDICRADCIEKAGFSVIDVPHDRHNRSARQFNIVAV